MNHDDHKPDLSTLIDPELETRIVAWVSSEASPFEAAELTRLSNEKPELAIFKRRIEAIHGLVAEAIRPDQEILRLAPERRTKLLQALGATETQPSPAKPTNTVVLPLAATKRKQRVNRGWMLGMAASLAIGLFTVLSFQDSRSFEAKHKMRMPVASSSEPRDVDDRYSDEVKRKEVSLAGREHFGTLAKNDADKKRGLADNERLVKHKQEKSKDSFGLQGGTEGKTRAQTEYQSLKFSEDGRTYGAIRFDATPGSPPPPTVAVAGSGAERMQPITEEVRHRRALRQQSQPAAEKSVVDRNDMDPAAAPITADPSAVVTINQFSVRSPKDGGTALAINEQRLSVNTKLVAAADAFGDANQSNVGEFLKHLPKPAVTNAGEKAGDEAIVLSPFSVEAKGDAGYKAQDSPAGTRPSQAANDNEDDKVLANTISAQRYTPPAKPSPDLTTEINASKEPVSTFSLHVSDVSFRLAQAALAKGEELDRASIRPEEFYNAFSYGDPTPAIAEKVSCRVEQAAHPFVQQRNLVRIAVKVASSGRDAAQPLHLTVLLDTSGSMEREDRAAIIRRGMDSLVSLLGANDRLTLIGFARTPRLLAESLPGDQAAQVLNTIANTPAEGGTNLEEALKLAAELAHRQFDAAAQNRIVLLTDGAANLGNANPAQLAATIEALRQEGIAFDACGVGLEGLDDNMLENLTRKGDGRYYVLNTPEAADAGFAKQLAGAFRPAAENVKLQVRFNPARVGNYRLIGFEQHRLNEEDFRNDKVDAAELAAEEAAVAVYQVEALPQGEGELGEVYVRFRDAVSGNMVERSWTLNYDAQAPAFDRATPTIQLAGVAALLAEKLRGGEAGDAVNLADLAPIVNKLRSRYANEPRVQELVTMFDQARKLSGE